MISTLSPFRVLSSRQEDLRQRLLVAVRRRDRLDVARLSLQWVHRLGVEALEPLIASVADPEVAGWWRQQLLAGPAAQGALETSGLVAVRDAGRSSAGALAVEELAETEPLDDLSRLSPAEPATLEQELVGLAVDVPPSGPVAARLAVVEAQRGSPVPEDPAIPEDPWSVEVPAVRQGPASGEEPATGDAPMGGAVLEDRAEPLWIAEVAAFTDGVFLSTPAANSSGGADHQQGSPGGELPTRHVMAIEPLVAKAPPAPAGSAQEPPVIEPWAAAAAPEPLAVETPGATVNGNTSDDPPSAEAPPETSEHGASLADDSSDSAPAPARQGRFARLRHLVRDCFEELAGTFMGEDPEAHLDDAFASMPEPLMRDSPAVAAPGEKPLPAESLSGPSFNPFTTSWGDGEVTAAATPPPPPTASHQAATHPPSGAIDLVAPTPLPAPLRATDLAAETVSALPWLASAAAAAPVSIPDVAASDLEAPDDSTAPAGAPAVTRLPLPPRPAQSLTRPAPVPAHPALERLRAWLPDDRLDQQQRRAS